MKKSELKQIIKESIKEIQMKGADALTHPLADTAGRSRENWAESDLDPQLVKLITTALDDGAEIYTNPVSEPAPTTGDKILPCCKASGCCSSGVIIRNKLTGNIITEFIWKHCCGSRPLGACCNWQ